MHNNILITFTRSLNPLFGGVERVYHNLVPYFTKNGYHVYTIYREKSEYDDHSVYTHNFFVEEKAGYEAYKRMIHDVISRYEINIIICPYPDYQLFDYLSRCTKLNVFFHVHNAPKSIMFRIPEFVPGFLRNKFVGNEARKIRRNVRYSAAFKRIEKNGMKIVLLSDQFRNEMKEIWNFNDSTIHAVPNPFCIDENFDIRKQNKNKKLLYVGRLSETQKRISSLLNIWKMVQGREPDICLDIVGDGPDRANFERIAKEMHLERVTFHGFQNPTTFYKQALCVCMTSNYEGFGMVLVEAMQYGCIPFAFNSYAALKDVIDDGINGYVIKPFDEEDYVNKLVNYIKSPEKEKHRLMCNAIEKSKYFSVEEIGKRWMELFTNY